MLVQLKLHLIITCGAKLIAFSNEDPNFHFDDTILAASSSITKADFIDGIVPSGENASWNKGRTKCEYHLSF